MTLDILLMYHYQSYGLVILHQSIFVPLLTDTGMKSIRRQQTGCLPTQSSVLRWPSSVVQVWAVWLTCWMTRLCSSTRIFHVFPSALVSCLWQIAFYLKLVISMQAAAHTVCVLCCAVLCSARPCRSAGVREAAGPWVRLHAGQIPLLRGLQHTHGKLQYVKYMK